MLQGVGVDAMRRIARTRRRQIWGGKLRQFASLENLGWQHHARRVPQVFRSEEDEKRDRDPDEDRDIDRFTKAGTCTLVLDGIEQADEFVLFEHTETTGLNAKRLGTNGVRDRRVRYEGERCIGIER